MSSFRPSTSSLRRLTASLLLGATIAAGVGVTVPASAATATDVLQPTQTLSNEHAITSSNGYQFVMQRDGNGVIYKPTSSGRVAIWASNTAGHANSHIAMQTDGNLVMYDAGGAFWATGSKGAKSYLLMQTDGNLVMYQPIAGGRRAVWASNSSQGSTGATPVGSSRAESAIAWMKSRVGSRSYDGRCELAVEMAYGTKGRYSSAKTAWTASVSRNVAHKGDRNPPRGALVYWNTSSNHHVAISLGDGTVMSTSTSTGIGRVALSNFKNYLGWAPPLY